MAEKIEGKAHLNLNLATDLSFTSWIKALKELTEVKPDLDAPIFSLL
jgi:hypothetical protein